MNADRYSCAHVRIKRGLSQWCKKGKKTQGSVFRDAENLGAKKEKVKKW